MAGAPQEALPDLVRSKYVASKNVGAVIFAESQVAASFVNGVAFQLRYCPSLAKKPTKPGSADHGQSKKRFDPFDNPSLDLLVAETSENRPDHIIVLNKFPIINNHFILATKTSKEQTHLLQEDDVYQTYQCLRQWSTAQSPESSKGRLFGFFNSGDHSGASQPHRHIQFLPVEDIEDDETPTWEPVPNQVVESLGEASLPHQLRRLRSLPFVHFGLPVAAGCSSSDLHGIYRLLYKAAAASVRRYNSGNEDALQYHSTTSGGLPISYNLGMTEKAMVICPRRNEGLVVQREDQSDIGMVALNGTLLGGTLMVKDEELFTELQEHPHKLIEVLRTAGLPAGEGYDELHEEDLSDGKYPELTAEYRSASAL